MTGVLGATFMRYVVIFRSSSAASFVRLLLLLFNGYYWGACRRYVASAVLLRAPVFCISVFCTLKCLYTCMGGFGCIHYSPAAIKYVVVGLYSPI